MRSAEYVELHAHSAYSFGDGASAPHEMAVKASEFGYTHYAITDHDSLAGALEFAHMAKAVDLIPITGAEVTVAGPAGQPCDVTLIARTHIGYRNLCRMLSKSFAPRGMFGAGDDDAAALAASIAAEAEAKVERDRARWHSNPPGRVLNQATRIQGTPERPDPLLELDQLLEHAEGLTILTGCAYRGLLPVTVDTTTFSTAASLVKQLQSAFGQEYVYVELQLCDHRGDAARNRTLCDIASSVDAPIVATGNVHAHTKLRGRLHDVLVAVHHNTTLEACEAERIGNLSLVMRSPEANAQRWQAHPEAIKNTRRIADSIEFNITSNLGYSYPGGGGGGSDIAELAAISRSELEYRYAGRPSYAEAVSRLERELKIIDMHGLAGFFLLHRDVLQLAAEVARDVRGDSAARRANPPGRGRGSSVESIVCYLTGLSHIDPIESRLPLGRFMNEELPSIPDIDLDFPRDIRQELLRRSFVRYGNERCAMVAAHATYRTKSAIRDVGKALSLPQAELHRIANQVGSYNARKIAEHVTGKGRRWEAFKVLTSEIADLPRQMGLHSGGLIISSNPLIDIVPVQPAATAGRQVCQWDKDSCADAGFLKIDVLGLGMLSSVEESLDTIMQVHGESIDLSRINYDDHAVYDQIQEGDTMGMFQIESRAQIASVRRTKPENLHDLTIQVALIRPGPVVGESVNPYIATRQKLRADPTAQIEYDHPILESVLKDTYGAIIFQDQVIEVAMVMAGFSAGEADGLRRAMTRKRSAEALNSYRERFIEGAIKNGVDAETAEKVFNRTTGFSKYGFPKAHAAAFALLAYQSAWLRHYYPAPWYAAMLNAQPAGFYPPDTLVRDALRHGVKPLSVDVNASDALWMVQEKGTALRVGLSYVNGIGWDDALAICAERETNGPYKNLEDLAHRISLRTDQLEKLISAGATDCFGVPRREQLWSVGVVARPKRGMVANSTQHPLDLEAPDAPQLPELSDWEQLALDYEGTGVGVHKHPMELLRPLLGPNIIHSGNIADQPDNTKVEIVSTSVIVQRPATAKGVVFLLLEDEFGTVNVVVKPPLASKHHALLRQARYLHIVGHIDRRDTNTNIVAHSIQTLPAKLRRKLPSITVSKLFG